MPLLTSCDRLLPHTALLGTTDDGRPLIVRLPSPDVIHVLVAGDSCCGKSELIKTILTSLANQNKKKSLQMALIHYGSDELYQSIATLPHFLSPPAKQPERAQSLLEFLNEEMDRRDKEQIQLPRIVVAIDDTHLLLESNPLLGNLISRLVQRGREAAIHVILSIQSPVSNSHLSRLTANFPVRLTGRVDSTKDAYQFTNTPASGAENLKTGQFVASGGGIITKFEAAIYDHP